MNYYHLDSPFHKKIKQSQTQIYEHPDWQGPYLGPRPTGHIKDWSEEKLRAGEGIVPLQAGTNKFATQKGLRIGRARDIMLVFISDACRGCNAHITCGHKTNIDQLHLRNSNLIRFANTCVEDKEGLGEWHEPENKENGEDQEAQE